LGLANSVILFQGSVSMMMEPLSGESFAVSSLEALGGAVMSLTCHYSDGDTVQTTIPFAENWTTTVLDSSWQNLQQIEFVMAGEVFTAIDNIVVSTVPIPATVWLFGSALAGLGWMRRKVA
jgi:hypothetical protein